MRHSINAAELALAASFSNNASESKDPQSCSPKTSNGGMVSHLTSINDSITDRSPDVNQDIRYNRD